MDRPQPLPRVLVCGGRNFEDELLLAVTMESIRETRGISMVIGGGSRGADTMAEEWAKSRAIECVVFDVDWVGLGRAAGPIRNQQMFDEGKPNLVVAVPGGRVTADMAQGARCRRRGDRGRRLVAVIGGLRAQRRAACCLRERLHRGCDQWYRTQLLPKRGMIYTIRVIVPCRARGLDEDDCTSSRS